MMNPEVYQRQLEEASQFLQQFFGPPPEIAIFFGSGLGNQFLEKISPAKKNIASSQVPHFHTPTIQGHLGKIFYANLAGCSALAVQGRIHLYEGLSPWEVVFPLRALRMWGIKKMVLTNAAGGLNPRLKKGDLVLVTDHLNFTGTNPLIGPNLDFLGPRFPTISHAYQNRFSQSVSKAARRIKLPIKKGIYVGVAGPSYETMAEIKAFQKLGGDVVGMSTVHEVIAAAHAGVELAVLSAVVNSSHQIEKGLTHEEVLQVAHQIDTKLTRLLMEVMKNHV